MANQIIIDIGAVANDGTGDPLRTAFNYVNDNFSNVWNTGLPESNLAFSGNRILTVNTNGNLILAPNGVGKVVTNVDIIPNSNLAHSLGAQNRRWNTVYTQNIDVNGNIVASGDVDFTGDVIIDGNLTVNGTTTTINTSNVDIEDKIITIAFGSPNATSANGAGINVAGANANINYNQSGNSWVFNIGMVTRGNILPLSTNTFTLGNSVLRWKELYVGNISAGNIINLNSIFSLDAYVTRGTFSGDPVTGSASLYVGSPTFTDLGTDVMAQFTGNVPGYTQLNIQNYGSSNVSSGDYIITADNGTDSTRFLNLGLAGSNWDGTQENSLGNLLQPNWGYLYVQDGGLVVGTKTGSTANVVTFNPNGTVTVPGDIIPVGNNTQSLGNATNQWQDLWVSNATIYMNSVPLSLEAGNVLTVGGQPVLSNDSNTTINTTGNITATNLTATELLIGTGGIETQGIQFVDNIYSGGSVNILNNGDYLIYESTGVPFVPHSNNAEQIGADDIRWGEIFGNSVYANTVISDNIITDLGPATGNIVSNVRTWDSAGANLYVWFDANQTPEIVDLNTISGGNVTGWTVSVNGGNQALITATNPAGYFSISTDQALTGSGTLTFTSPNYAPPVPNPLTVTVGAKDWIFDSTGNLTLPQGGNINENSGQTARFQALDEGAISRAAVILNAGDGLTRLESYSSQNSRGYGTADWATGTYVDGGGYGEIAFTDAPAIVSYMATVDNSRVFFEVNNGNLLPNNGWGTSGNNITFYVPTGPASSPETVTSFVVYSADRSVIEMDYDEGEMNLIARNLDINIRSDQSIDLITNDIIRLQNTGNVNGVAIITDTANAFHVWNFLPNGNLTLPQGGTINEGPSPSYLGNAVTITPANGSDPNQQLKIYPTVVEGNHLHLTSGNLQVTDIFLGDDYQYIRTNNAGGMTIGTGGGETSFGPVWTFDAGGNLLLPGSHTSTITSTANASVYFTAQNNGINPIATINNVDMGTGLPTSQIEVKADSVWVTTNGNVVTKDWIFDNTGDLSAPGNITTTGTVSGQILVASQSAPNEGGEIQLALPSSGTTLTGNIIIDSYQNQIRFFESSGNSRGLYVDVPNVSVSGQYAIGYRDVPQIALTGNVTANSITAGKHFYSTTAGNLQVTIPDNANVAFPTGATITIVVNAAGNVIIAQGTGVSLYMAGSSTTGNRTVGAYGLASVMKVATDTWVISGTGVY